MGRVDRIIRDLVMLFLTMMATWCPMMAATYIMLGNSNSFWNGLGLPVILVGMFLILGPIHRWVAPFTYIISITYLLASYLFTYLSTGVGTYGIAALFLGVGLTGLLRTRNQREKQLREEAELKRIMHGHPLPPIELHTVTLR